MRPKFLKMSQCAEAILPAGRVAVAVDDVEANDDHVAVLDGHRADARLLDQRAAQDLHSENRNFSSTHQRQSMD